MKTNQKIVKSRKSVITMNTESRILSLEISQQYTDDTVDHFQQDFNMNVMPYDMAMSVICSLINPVERQRK